MNPIEEMVVVGQSPKRLGWLIKPLRRLLFPLVRPYFNYVVEHLQDATLLPPHLTDASNKLQKLDKRVQKLASKQQDLQQTATARQEVISRQLQRLTENFDDKDVMALLERLASLEDRLIEFGAVSRQKDQQLELQQHISAQLSDRLTQVQSAMADFNGQIAQLQEIEKLVSHVRDRLNYAIADLQLNVDNPVPLISYAQNCEDVLLNRVFSTKSDGFYIDVGAALPVDHSVTYHFYKKGWRGINIEPIPRFFNLFETERLRDINLRCVLGRNTGTQTFYEVSDNLGRSSLDAGAANEATSNHVIASYEVPMLTLNDLYSRYALDEVDFLKVDVEGWEHEVLAGNDWSKHRPRVLLIESVHPVTHAPEWESWEPMLLENGYLFAYFDGLNRFYVRHEDQDLLEQLRTPVSVLDHYIPYSLHRANTYLQDLQAWVEAKPSTQKI